MSTDVNKNLSLAQAASPHRSKVVAAMLAAAFGVVGAQWWYLGRRYAWLFTLVSCVLIALMQVYPVWWDNPPFLLLFIPASVGFIEALVFSLKPDAWFDKRYNRATGQTTSTGLAPVLIAILSTMIGSSVLILGLSLAIIYVYKTMGWLEGYVL